MVNNNDEGIKKGENQEQTFELECDDYDIIGDLERTT